MVWKRRPKPIDLDSPGNANVVLADGTGIMLELYYEAEGFRDLAEIKRFHEQKVAVVGVLHARAPDQLSEDGIPMQTMIGPYIGSIESITLLE